MDKTARCAQCKRLISKTMHGWRAVYIERCPCGSVGGSQKPDLATGEGAGSPPNIADLLQHGLRHPPASFPLAPSENYGI